MFLLVILCRKTRGGMDSFQLLGLVGEGEIRAGGIVYKSPQGQQGDGGDGTIHRNAAVGDQVIHALVPLLQSSQQGDLVIGELILPRMKVNIDWLSTFFSVPLSWSGAELAGGAGGGLGGDRWRWERGAGWSRLGNWA